MFTLAKPYRQWSDIGLAALVISIAAAVAISLLDGLMKGPIEAGQIADSTEHSRAMFAMLSVWVVDFRYLSEQAVYAATIFFVGAKFFETRTVFTVGFDKMDTDKVSMKGPDENNIVWIGYRYANRLEAETIAEAFAERLRASAGI
jgi:hypothetical protein